VQKGNRTEELQPVYKLETKGGVGNLREKGRKCGGKRKQDLKSDSGNSWKERIRELG